jgi:hypothetical protein
MCRIVRPAGMHDYKGLSGSNSRGEAQGQVNIATSIFSNHNCGNFRLAALNLVNR